MLPAYFCLRRCVLHIMAHNSERLYSQLTVYGGNYYIHKHIENIGRMNNQSPLTDSQIASIYNQYKQDSAIATKKQYIDYVKRSIISEVKPGVQKVLDNALDPENTNDKILNRLHNVLMQNFEKQFNNQAVLTAMNKQAELNWSVIENDSAMELDKILTSNGTSGDPFKGFKFLDQILGVLAETCKLLKTKQGNKLAVILASQKSNYKTTKELGTNLRSALEDFIQRYNGTKVTLADVKEGLYIANLINNFAITLEKNQTNNGAKNQKYLSLRGLQGIFQNNIFPKISELFINHVQVIGVENIYDTIGAVIKSTSQSADDPVYIQAYTPEGEIIKNQFLKNVGLTEGKERKDAGKADSLYNIDLNLETITGKTHGSITMSIGISTKAYLDNSIGVPLTSVTRDEDYSLGKGLNLGQAFSLIPHLSQYDRYLGYNIIARKRQDMPSSAIALQDVLITRGLSYLAAGRSAQDSAQLLFLNGNIMSMWDVIKYGLENNIGFSRGGIYWELKNQKNILNLAKPENNFYTRVVQVNSEIEKSVIKLEIIPRKILSYINSLNLTS